jgi:putative hydrolase of the HAD superfamily
MISTIIFDVGGTLVDAPDLFEELSNKINEKYSIDVKKELVDEFRKLYYSEDFLDIKSILNLITLKILNEHNIKSANIDSAQIYVDIFLNKSFLFEESKEVLDYLKYKKINLIIVSDADADVLIPELKKLEIYNYFKKILISSDLKCYKTSKNIVEKIGSCVDVLRNDVLFVGDAKVDVDTAMGLGVKSVLVCRNASDIVADFKIESLRDLKKLIENRFKFY